MEARIARLESDVSHLVSDVGEIKLDLRALRDDLASAKIWALMLYMSLAALNFGALARSFGWL